MDKSILGKVYNLISLSRSMIALFEREKSITSKYVHATSKGHEVIQISAGIHLKNDDFLYPYYSYDSMLLSIVL